MLRRSNCLPLLVLASVSIILLLSCTQSEDVVTPVSTTDLVLKAERLPSPPPGMVYELWVSKPGDTVSLGKFSYDAASGEFRTTAGAARSDTFALNVDVLTFTKVLVSIEESADPNPASPGPIMLIDDVTRPEDDPIRLRFPEADSLWNATVKFNLETPTDLNRDAADGHGLWFSGYAKTDFDLPDTTFMEWTVDSVTEEDSAKFPYTYQCSVTDTSYTSDTITLGSPEFLWMGASLPVHLGVKFHLFYCTDSTPPFVGEVVKVTFTAVQHSYFKDWFNQFAFILPDVSRFGWHYKGWVVTPYPTTKRWKLTPPAYRYNTANLKLIPGDTGALFTTGPFVRVDQADTSNPFCLDNPRPPFPGEDFMNSTALQNTYGVDSVNLMPLTTGNVGTVFITLEPDNFTQDTTNFPLFVLMRSLPSLRSAITGTTVQLDMTNYTQTIQGNSIGFPEIDISLKRY
jgi:hypothetical protein